MDEVVEVVGLQTHKILLLHLRMTKKQKMSFRATMSIANGEAKNPVKHLWILRLRLRMTESHTHKNSKKPMNLLMKNESQLCQLSKKPIWMENLQG